MIKNAAKTAAVIGARKLGTVWKGIRGYSQIEGLFLHLPGMMPLKIHAVIHGSQSRPVCGIYNVSQALQLLLSNSA